MDTSFTTQSAESVAGRVLAKRSLEKVWELVSVVAPSW
jgi:hypothetical protein